MKAIQDSLVFWIPRRGFQDCRSWISVSVLVELVFWIPIVCGIPDSSSCVPDSKAQDSRFQKQSFSRIPLNYGAKSA